MSDPCNELSPRKQRGLELLLAGLSIPEAARQLGCRRETVWRWTQDPTFAVEMSRCRARRTDAVTLALEQAAAEAVGVLRDVMSDDAHSGVVRVRAAQQLLDRSGFGREQTWRVEATARTESVVDTVRVRDARATGDPQKLLMAMQEDTEELRVILGALIQSGGVP